MAGSSTREHCRECGKVTLHKVIKQVPGFVIWRVVCEDCQEALERIANADTSNNLAV